MVTSPLVKPAKKIKWSSLASWREMEEAKKDIRQSEGCQREKKREGVQVNSPHAGGVGPLSSSSHSHITQDSAVCPHRLKVFTCLGFS